MASSSSWLINVWIIKTYNSVAFVVKAIIEYLVGSHLFNSVLHHKLVLLPELFEYAPAVPAIRNRIVLLPTSTRVVVKVITGIDTDTKHDHEIVESSIQCWFLPKICGRNDIRSYFDALLAHANLALVRCDVKIVSERSFDQSWLWRPTIPTWLTCLLPTQREGQCRGQSRWWSRRSEPFPISTCDD